MWKSVQKVIGLVPAYNKAIKKTTGDILYENLTAAEKKAIDDMVAASKDFKAKLDGGVVSLNGPRFNAESTANRHRSVPEDSKSQSRLPADTSAILP